MSRRADCGFIYAVTGASYLATARRAARTLRLAMPDASIDLYTNIPVEDDIFDRIFLLADDFHRPKIEALRRSRFDRTVFLDSDTAVLCDVSELFALLDRADIAAAQGWARVAQFYIDPAIPRAFPMLNTGVLAMRRNRRTGRFLTDWEARLRNEGAKVDQGHFRACLYEHRLPFIVIPHEYNMIWPEALDIWPDHFGAPRILHVRDLHRRPPGDPSTPFALPELLSDSRAARLAELIARDRDWPAPPTCDKDGRRADILPEGLVRRIGRLLRMVPQ